MPSDDNKHEMRMHAGNAAMTIGDLLSEDEVLEAIGDIGKASERLASLLRARDIPLGAILGILAGATCEPVVRGLDP